MRKKFILSIAVLMLAGLCGCAALLIGGGVAGGIAVSKDTAKLEKDVDFNRAWATAYQVIDKMGLIKLKDQEAGTIEAIVRDSKINVQVSRITAKAVKIEVRARKNLFPNMDLAMEIINKINAKMK